MKKIFLVFWLCAFLFACNNEMVRVAEDLTEYRKQLIEYTLSGDYKVDESEIESELNDIITRIQSGIEEEEAPIDTEDSAVIASVKSFSPVSFKLNKVGNYKSIDVDTVESPIYQTKSASGMSSDTGIVNIDEWNVEYADGRISRVLTSDDRRIGIVLFVSDPISKDTSFSQESIGTTNEFIDGMIDGHISNIRQILSSATQEEIDEVGQIVEEEGETDLMTKSPFWKTGNWSSWKFQYYHSPMIKTNWGFSDSNTSFYIHRWSGMEYQRTLDKKTGAVAIAQVANYLGKWNNKLLVTSFDKLSNDEAYFVANTYVSLTCRGVAETHMRDYDEVGYHTVTGSTIAATMRRHGYTVYHKAKPISIMFTNEGVSQSYINEDIKAHKKPSIGVLVNSWKKNGWSVGRVVVFDGTLSKYRTRDKWRFWKKSTDYEWNIQTHVNMCEGGAGNGWYNTLALGGCRAVSELICNIR